MYIVGISITAVMGWVLYIKLSSVIFLVSSGFLYELLIRWRSVAVQRIVCAINHDNTRGAESICSRRNLHFYPISWSDESRLYVNWARAVYSAWPRKRIEKVRNIWVNRNDRLTFERISNFLLPRSTWPSWLRRNF